MVTDADINVWLDMVERVNPPVVVPFVQSSEGGSVNYRVRVIKQGQTGRSVIGQSGAVSLQPSVPAALSRISLNSQGGSRCDIEIILTRNDMKTLHYHFECPT